MTQENLQAKAEPDPVHTVHMGHGVKRSANHLQFISQISSESIGPFKTEKQLS